jgi:hypothetical protein
LVVKLDLLLPHTFPVELVLEDQLVNLGLLLHDTEVSTGVDVNEMLDLLILQVALEDILGGLRLQPVWVAKRFFFVILRVLFGINDFLLKLGSAEGRLNLDHFVSEVEVEPINVLALRSTRSDRDSTIGHILARYGVGGYCA